MSLDIAISQSSGVSTTQAHLMLLAVLDDPASGSDGVLFRPIFAGRAMVNAL